MSYIGREGNNVLINGAAVLCPAWDLKHLENLNPWVDKMVTKGIVEHFLKYDATFLKSISVNSIYFR